MRSDDTVSTLEACATKCVHPEKVAMVQAAALPASELGRAAALFKLLGDPTRATLLYALLEAGELCVCDLAAATRIQEATARRRCGCCASRVPLSVVVRVDWCTTGWPTHTCGCCST
jgi:hypothetical protein